MTKSLPILVTYRSAVELKHAGMWKAYFRLGGYLFLASAILFALIAWLLASRNNELAAYSAVAGLIGLWAYYVCQTAQVTPLEPSLTEDEIDAFRDDLHFNEESIQLLLQAVSTRNINEPMWKITFWGGPWPFTLSGNYTFHRSPHEVHSE